MLELADGLDLATADRELDALVLRAARSLSLRVQPDDARAVAALAYEQLAASSA